MGPDKFDNKSLVLKKYFSSLNKTKKNWFYWEKKSQLVINMQIF